MCCRKNTNKESLILQRNTSPHVNKQWRIQRRGPAPPPPLFLDQADARREEKNFFETTPPPVRVWMTAPPLLSEGQGQTEQNGPVMD